MRVVVHHGMSKAGSTALQKGLARARGPLLEQGVLYPTAPIIGHSHNLVMAGILPPGKLPRFVRHSLEKQGAGAEGGAALFARWIAAMGETAARSGARVLVLSAENLWGLEDPEPAARLRAALVGLGATRIETLAYLRRPSDWYLSIVHQVLAASHVVRPAAAIPYRAPIEAVARGLADPGAARLVAYDRDAFPGGDVLAHFLDSVLDGVALPPSGRPREANATLSAEGMDLLQSYRLHVHPEAQGAFTDDTRRFRTALDRAERAVEGYARPALRPGLRRRIDESSGDLPWLRDAHGIVFEGVDYDAVSESGWRRTFARIDQVCPVDPARRERLAMAALAELARPRRRGAGARAAGGAAGGDGA